METGLMERVLTELVRFEIAASDHARAIAPERTREEAQMALQREHALQATLRDALLLRNREAAREPVRAAAERLGVQVSEDNSDWVALAYEATRVLLDLSVERSQLDQGVFSAPSRFFEAAMKADAAPSMPAYRAEPAAIAVHAAPVAHVVAEPATATTPAPVSAPLAASEPIQPPPPICATRPSGVDGDIRSEKSFVFSGICRALRALPPEPSFQGSKQKCFDPYWFRAPASQPLPCTQPRKCGARAASAPAQAC